MSVSQSSNSRSALREPVFRRYFTAACLSTLGTWITRFLLGWSAWDLTRSALWVGITSTCLLFPAIVLSPLFGVVSDRVNPRNGMLITLSFQAVVSGLAAATIASGRFSLDGLLVLALAVGSISAAHQPLRLSLVPRLVSRDILPSAIGLSSVIFNLSRIVGPAVAGAIIANTSSAAVFLLATLLFSGSFLALLRVRIVNEEQPSDRSGVWTELLEGLRFARNTPTIRLILSMTLVNGLLGRTVIELLPAISGKLLNGSVSMLAVLTAAAGVGSILGGLLLSRQRDNETTMVRLVLISLAGAALATLLINWANNPWLLAPLIGYLSLATTMTGIGSQALTQFAVSDQFRGRVMSLWAVLTMGVPALGGFAMGALADRLGFGVTLIGFAAIAVVSTSYLWRRERSIVFADQYL